MKFIFLNGPPRSGKDTACNAILSMRHPSIRVMRRMSEPLKAGVAGIFGWTAEQQRQFEERKDSLEVADTNKTYREWQIALSEDFLKPKAGQDIFGRLFLQYCLQHGSPHHVWVCPDAGFKAEIMPILRVFKPHNLFLIHIVRPGTDFSNDSRSYFELENVATMQLHNFGERHELEANAARFARLWLDSFA
jgi:hypothetical protein